MCIFIAIVMFLLGCLNIAVYGSTILEGYLSQLPVDLQLKEDEPQKYLFICDYFYTIPQGDVIRKQRVSGEYMRGLPDGKVKWNNVKVAQADGLDDEFPEGEKQEYMEDFTYRPLTDDVSKPEFFQGFPPSMIDTRNLIWDTLMFEGFGWSFFDKLQLNRTYCPSEVIGEVPLAGIGTFQNKKIELTWLGISKMNGETCALIQYRAFFNKFNVSTEAFAVRGGSHYWGEIWVSLEDKQIEHATLYENVTVETRTADQQSWQVGSCFRRGTFQKL